MYCTVANCVHPDNHNIKGHKCRECGEFGHGRVECGYKRMIKSLAYNELENYCTIKNCRYSQYHTTQGHLCRLCNNYGHSRNECMNSTPEKIAGNTDGKIYVAIAESLGCMNYYRRDNVHDTFQHFFMHSDSWGQYGNTKELDNLKNFIGGYTPLREVDKL